MIVLDWSRPSRMMPELLAWLRWIDQWTGAAANGQKGTSEVDSGVGVMSMREKCKLYFSLCRLMSTVLGLDWAVRFSISSPELMPEMKHSNAHIAR